MLGALEQTLGPVWPLIWTLVKIVAIVVPLMLWFLGSMLWFSALAPRFVWDWAMRKVGFLNAKTLFAAPAPAAADTAKKKSDAAQPQATTAN